MQTSMLYASDIQVYRHPIRRIGDIKGCFIVPWREIAQIVPGRADKGIHGVRLPPRLAAAGGACCLDPIRAVIERVAAVLRYLSIHGQPDGKLRLRNRNDPARVAINNGNGRPPITLARDEPIPQTVLLFSLSPLLLFKPLRNLRNSL